MPEPTKRPKRKLVLAVNDPPGRAVRKDDHFPIVGIGTSAGGLDALELFLKGVAKPSGTAFVIVQHLDPTQKGMLVELLARISPLPVLQVADGMTVEIEHVYVIPPNKDMSIVHGVLHLLVPIAPRGLRLPIDFFFRSLADDMHERSVGVILSGMGSDGTRGVRAIREQAGSVFVQTPESAKFDAMPRSAIEAGLADVIAVSSELPGKIEEYLRHAYPRPRAASVELDRKAHGAVEKLIGLLRTETGHDFSPYKSSTIYRRVERRMGLHQVGDIGNYVRYVRENPEEAQLLFGELLIGVTSFFRDPGSWERLQAEVLTPLLETAPKGSTIRAWVPACSTGEEAYALAIAFKETQDKAGLSKNLTFQIFATDLDGGAVQRARQGVYMANIAADVGEERLARFFVKDERGFRVGKEIRDLVIFAVQNALQDPPFTKLDLLSCRNLLIYLNPEAQQKLIQRFHYSLKPDASLFLGSAETVGGRTDQFSVVDAKARIYRRIPSLEGDTPPIEIATLPAITAAGSLDNALSTARGSGALTSAPLPLQAQVEQFILKRFGPSAVLVSNKGDVLFVSGRTARYLELPPGKANWNILAMAREGLRHLLSGAFQRAIQGERPITLKGVRLGRKAVGHVVDVTLEPVFEPPTLRGTVMVVFTDVAQSSKTVTAIGTKRMSAVPGGEERLEGELQQVREHLRAAGEEAQTTEEELKSANEELQSSNEELQSTNEELTTSKEEVQSMNEELQTLNNELSAKLSDLSRASNDMRNLLDSTEIAILFLDDALNVRRFTPQVATLIKLIPGDVGRPLSDIATELDYADMTSDACNVLRSSETHERRVGSRSGRRFSVRIMPYRTNDNRIDGVVITFTPLSADEPRLAGAEVAT